MAVMKGVSGSLKLTTNVVAEMQNWSLDVSQDYVDTTSFGDSFREQTPTFASWTATADGKLDTTDTNGQTALQAAWLGGTTVTPRFYVSAGNYFSGLAYVSATVSAAVDGVCEVKYSFTSAGTLSYT